MCVVFCVKNICGNTPCTNLQGVCKEGSVFIRYLEVLFYLALLFRGSAGSHILAAILAGSGTLFCSVLTAVFFSILDGLASM